MMSVSICEVTLAFVIYLVWYTDTQQNEEQRITEFRTIKSIPNYSSFEPSNFFLLKSLKNPS